MSTEPRMDDWATHLPALMACLAATKGPVLECGAGIWSTPILHAACAPTRRQLLTLEHNPAWLGKFTHLTTEWHTLQGVPSWAGWTAPDAYWSVAFVDQGHAPRGPVLGALRHKANFVVMHDSECHYCGYGPELAGYDWVYTHTHSPTWTTIAGMGPRPTWMESALPPGVWGLPACYRG